MNTDDERIRCHLNCLLLLNGIESLDRSEILSRVYEIHFDQKHQRSHFVETTVIDALLESRAIIISGWLRLLADHVLPRIASGGIAEWKADLDQRHANHPKARSFEFLARMGLIAEALERVWFSHYTEKAALGAAKKRIDAILDRQGTTASEADAETNVLANLLHALVAERRNWDSTHGTFPSRYHLDVVLDKNRAHLTATASELCYAFAVLSKNAGIRGLGVRNPRSLAARLSSDAVALEASGIEVKHVGKKHRTNVYAISINQESYTQTQENEE